MKFCVRNDNDVDSDYYEKKRNKPYIPSSVEPKPLDQYWDIWATYVIEKVEFVNDELVLYALKVKSLTYPRNFSEYVSIDKLLSEENNLGYKMK